MKAPIAHRIEGIQPYWFAEKLRLLQEMNEAGIPVLNLGIGNPDLPPPSAAVRALSMQAQQPDVHGYQSYRGIPEFRQAISDWSKRIYQIELDPDSEILPLIGSKEGIQHISMAFVNPGESVWVPNPGYMTYRSVTELAGGIVQEYRVTDAGIEGLNPSPQTKIVWLNFPHMPTGLQPDREALNKLIQLARKQGFIIVNDNPYSTILTLDHFSIFQLEGAKEVCLELNSLSKSHNMAGWRLGWVAGRAELIDEVLKVKSQMDSGMFRPVQKAAIQALRVGGAWIAELNSRYKARRKIGRELLEYLGCQVARNRSGLFLWARIPESADSAMEFSDSLLSRYRVFITPGTIFGSEGDRYIRLSLCSTEALLTQAITRVNKQIVQL